MKTSASLICLFLTCFAAPAGERLATPTAAQQLYQDLEVIMFIHWSANTGRGPEFDDGKTPLDEINPAKTDVNQWIDAAEAIGARQILYVAKHVGGFCTWQTDTSEYSIRNTPYQDGKGDILRDLSDACWERGIKLGIYVYPGDLSRGVTIGSAGRTKDPARQEEYNRIIRQQWTEVLSRYGKIHEVWFDGSCIVPLDDIVEKHAPDAMVMQSKNATIRWVGTERGYAPYPAWNGVKSEHGKTGVSTAAHGDPDGDMWLPLEVNTTLKDHFWFWQPANEGKLKTLEYLIECYYKSVGRGHVFLLNAAPDAEGLIPEADMKLYRRFGEAIRERFSKPLASTAGKGGIVELDFGAPTAIDHVIIMEDIAFGERVRRYVLEGRRDGEWFEICKGTAIGHKRIDRFAEARVDKIRFRCVEAPYPPVIRSLSAYLVRDSNKYEKLGSHTDAYGNPWDIGAGRSYEGTRSLGSAADFHDTKAGRLVIDLSAHIDEPGQYELYLSKGDTPEHIVLRPYELWLEGIKSADFIGANTTLGALDLNLGAMPAKQKGSIVVRCSPKKKNLDLRTLKIHLRRISLR